MSGLFQPELQYWDIRGPTEIDPKRIPEFPMIMDKANYALQLMAEGKLNISSGNNNKLELEQLNVKNFRNNLIIGVLGIVIFALLVF